MKRAILVKSCQRFYKRAVACVETWLGDLQRRRVLGYVVRAGDGKPTIYDEVLIILTSAGDSYGDNSIKVKQAIALLLKHQFEHLFICDDDTFVHPKRWLAHEPQGDLECRVFHPVKEADKKRNNGQPWIHGGAGWWMSRRLCELYVAECNERTSADDIIVARIAAKHGIEMHDRPDLYGSDEYSGYLDRVAADNELITCHHVQPAEMLKLWEATRGF